MKKIFKIFLLSLLLVLFFSSSVQASNFETNVMNQVGAAASEQGAGLGDSVQDPQMFIVNIINIVLGAVGILFTSLIFYGGIMFLTAQGEEEKAKKGAGIVKAAIIGLLVVLASYAIVVFVSNMTDEINVTEEYVIDSRLL